MTKISADKSWKTLNQMPGIEQLGESSRQVLSLLNLPQPKEIISNQLITREALADLLDRFVEARVHHLGMREPKEIESFNAEYNRGVFTKSTAYDYKCTQYCIAWRILFDELNIPSFQIDSWRHTWILLPVRGHDGVDLLVLDPTIRQVHNGYPKEYFLGTRTELDDLNKIQVENSLYRAPLNVSSAHDFYFNEMRISASSGWCFKSDDIPQQLYNFFPREHLSLPRIDGTRDLAEMIYDIWCANLAYKNDVGKRATAQLLIVENERNEIFLARCREFILENDLIRPTLPTA
jgi:hypothetical protein